MTKKAFIKIAAGLNEAIAVARGEIKPAKLHAATKGDVKTTRTKPGQLNSAT